MLFKPKYCCQCGEEIKRDQWKLWTSRRFCELCETEFLVNEWVPKIYLGLSLVIGIFLFGHYLRTPGPGPPGASLPTTFRPVRPSHPGDPKTAPQNSDPQSLLANAVSGGTESLGNKTNEGSDGALEQHVRRPGGESLKVPRSDVDEAIFICGAETKKGTPCSRRVKNGGRCWQHTGRPAMRPEKELSVSR